MSNSAEAKAELSDRQALQRLERAVGRLLEELGEVRRERNRAEARARDVESLLRRFTQAGDDPSELHTRLVELEGENRVVRERMDEGRQAVERLLAKIRFLESQK